MNEDLVLTLFRYSLGIVGIWFVWKTIRIIKGAGQEKTNQENSGSQENRQDPKD